MNTAVWGKVRIVHSRVLLKCFIDQQRFPFDKNSNPGGMCVGEENFMTNVARKNCIKFLQDEDRPRVPCVPKTGKILDEKV